MSSIYARTKDELIEDEFNTPHDEPFVGYDVKPGSQARIAQSIANRSTRVKRTATEVIFGQKPSTSPNAPQNWKPQTA